MDLQIQITDLQRQFDELKSSSSIPNDVENALRQRLKNIGLSSLIYGRGTLAGGLLDIIDGRITSSSIGVAIRDGNSATGSFAQLSGGFQSGGVYRFFEGNFSATWTITYIIIP